MPQQSVNPEAAAPSRRERLQLYARLSAIEHLLNDLLAAAEDEGVALGLSRDSDIRFAALDEVFSEVFPHDEQLAGPEAQLADASSHLLVLEILTALAGPDVLQRLRDKHLRLATSNVTLLLRQQRGYAGDATDGEEA